MGERCLTLQHLTVLIIYRTIDLDIHIYTYIQYSHEEDFQSEVRY